MCYVYAALSGLVLSAALTSFKIAWLLSSIWDPGKDAAFGNTQKEIVLFICFSDSVEKNNLKGFPKQARIQVLQRECDKPCSSF